MAGHNLIVPSHRSIRKYYEQTAALRDQRVFNEISARPPFVSLRQETATLMVALLNRSFSHTEPDIEGYVKLPSMEFVKSVGQSRTSCYPLRDCFLI
jgi:hypothetical protein